MVLKNLAPKAYNMRVPFTYTAFVSDHAATLMGMVGMLAILLPMTRAIPALYVWTIRRQAGLLVPAAQGAGAAGSTAGGTRYDPEALYAEFDRIDSHVRVMRVPAYYSNQLYDLRGHIDLVRQRLAVMPEGMRMAAE